MTPGDAPLKFQWDPQDVAAIGVGTDTILFFVGGGGPGQPDSAITLDGINPTTIGIGSFV